MHSNEKNTVVNEVIRQKLDAFRVDKIAVYKREKIMDTANTPKEDIIAFKRTYQEGINSVKLIINDRSFYSKWTTNRRNDINIRPLHKA